MCLFIVHIEITHKAMSIFSSFLNPLNAQPTKWSNSSKSLAPAAEWFECDCPFCEVGA